MAAGFAWHVLIRPQAVGGGEQSGNAARPVLYDIVVEVSWGLDGGTRRVTLDTQRIGSTAAAGS